MTVLLSVLAFFVAFAALWCAAAAQHGVERRNEEFTRAYLKSVNGAVTESNRVVAEVMNRLAALEKAFQDFKTNRTHDTEVLKTLEQRTREIRAQMVERTQRDVA